MKTLIQISDCHIDDLPQTMGVNTHKNLSTILQNIANYSTDCLIITGDLTHNGSLKSYEIIYNYLCSIEADKVVLPGNHDNIENLKRKFSDNILREYCLDNWGIISAYSKLENQSSGYLSVDELYQLDDALKLSSAEHNIVILHHPPVPMCSDWDDSLSLQNMNDFFDIIDKHPTIRAILWGHAHQSSEFNRNEVKLISCPSTALQFDKEKRIGFNRYSLHENGEFEYTTKWL